MNQFLKELSDLMDDFGVVFYVEYDEEEDSDFLIIEHPAGSSKRILSGSRFSGRDIRDAIIKERKTPKDTRGMFLFQDLYIPKNEEDK